MAAILKEFGGVDVAVEVIEEKPEKAHPPSFFSTRPVVLDVAPIDGHGKVWIDGVGFMKNGKRLNDGRNKVSDRIMHAS